MHAGEVDPGARCDLQLYSRRPLPEPIVLTIGFARRFATYKRADMIFHDLDRLKKIISNRWRPVQIIFACKVHQSDDEGKRILLKIYQFARQPEFEGRIAIVDDYSERTAQYQVHGVDGWLNNPLPPMEACGTSGMKAGITGVLNMSIPDGLKASMAEMAGPLVLHPAKESGMW